MLYTPFVLGVAAARHVPWTLLLLLAAATLLFIARESMVLWLRAVRQRKDPGGLGRQLAIQVLLGAACGAVLVGREHRFDGSAQPRFGAVGHDHHRDPLGGTPR